MMMIISSVLQPPERVRMAINSGLRLPSVLVRNSGGVSCG